MSKFKGNHQSKESYYLEFPAFCYSESSVLILNCTYERCLRLIVFRNENTHKFETEKSLFNNFQTICSVRFILSINFHQISCFYNKIEVKTSDFFLEFVQSLFLNTVNRLIERALIVAFTRIEGQESFLIFRQPLEDGGKLKDEVVR